jgi:putative transposase
MKPYFQADRRRRHDLRRGILDAILLSLKTGCQWRMLPSEFAPWQTVYYYFRRWREEGRLQCLPWNILACAAGDHESRWVFQVLTPICGRTEQDKTVFADSAYQGLGEEVENKLGWSLSIVEREDKESGFSVDPKRSVARTDLQLARRLATTQ